MFFKKFLGGAIFKNFFAGGRGLSGFWEAKFQKFFRRKYWVILDGMMKQRFVVRCTQCGDRHTTDDVEFVNVESDIEGRDVCYFICPTTGEQTKSFVYMEVE